MKAFYTRHRNSGALMALMIFMSLAGLAQEPPGQDILTRLRARPEALELAIEARNAHEVEEATAILMDAIRKHSCDRPSPSEGLMSGVKCGGLAWALQALDPDSRTGEDYLVRPVEKFLAEFVPSMFLDEAAEKEMRFTPEFEAWGKERDLSPTEAEVLEIMYGNFLNLAAFIGDPKLVPLFRRGLESNAFPVVLFSIRGLALLHDKAALPEILAAIDRMKHMGEGPYYFLLGVLRDYNDAEVDRIIAKSPNEEMRKSILARPAASINLELRPKPKL
jgi:hypothetical protein